MARPAPRRRGNRDTRRDDANVSGTELARCLRERLRRAEHDPRPAHQHPRDPARASRELDVRPPELENERLPCLDRRQRRRKPVGVHDVGVARCSPRSMRVRREEQRTGAPSTGAASGFRLCRARTRARSAETTRARPPRRRGRRPQVLDRVAYERPRDVVRPARIRRREDDDLHSRRARATTGRAAASVAKT